jgi:hypothetical protein
MMARIRTESDRENRAPFSSVKCKIPSYIETRIRQNPPDGLPVVPGSTPVVAFGDVSKASVATLGLNPSRLEFQDRQRNDLVGPMSRLETLSSLGVSELSSAPEEAIRRVFEACNNYFHRCPYRNWFDDLNEVLKPRRRSFYDGTACHLDLVQWATDPTWGNLDPADRRKLVQADLPFLQKQLSLEHIRLLFLNGSGVAAQFRRAGICDVPEKVVPVEDRLRLFVWRTDRLTVVGWNENLQSSRRLVNDRTVKAQYLKALNAAIADELGET